MVVFKQENDSMISVNKPEIKRALRQVPSLIVLAALMAIGVNQFRPDGIPLIGEWSAEARFSDAAGDSLVISLARAQQLFKRDTTLFLDARPHNQFVEGHIQGALSLPWHDVDAHIVDLFDRLAHAETIITYCDGESCHLSHELALFLKDMTPADVHVLVNGWAVWRQAGLPTQTGE